MGKDGTGMTTKAGGLTLSCAHGQDVSRWVAIQDTRKARVVRVDAAIGGAERSAVGRSPRVNVVTCEGRISTTKCFRRVAAR